MRVAVIGAAGKAGSRIVEELIRRGHAVKGVARTPHPEAPIEMRLADANDPLALAGAIAGADAVISAGRFLTMKAEPILDAMRGAAVQRLLSIGGAGALLVNGVPFGDTPQFPDFAKPESEAGRAFLATLRASDADWTMLAPAVLFAAGERTGAYRLGGDTLMRDASGESSISYEDFAKALVDELEQPKHRRALFSIAY